MPECCCCIRLHAPIHKKNGGINDPGKGRRVFLATTDFMKDAIHAGIHHLLSTLTNTVASVTGVGGGKILRHAKDFSRILQNLPEENSQKSELQIKKLFMWFCVPFFQIKACKVHLHSLHHRLLHQ